MLQEDGNQKALNTFNIGTDSDTTPEMVEEGFYIDASNMEDANAVSGTGKGLSKIGGELALYIQNTSYCPNEGLPVYLQTTIPIPDPNGWLCIGVGDVNDHVVEFWVYNGLNSAAIGYTIIRIDGIVMCYTNAMGLLPQFPLQLDVNNSCVGGEIFITDFNVHPYIFNIQDIITNYYSNPPTGAYFSFFNPNLYSVTLQDTNDHPVFIDIVPASNGLVAGDYSYSIRLVDSTGNHTNWSVQTPYIPVALSVGGDTPYGNRTYGEAPPNYPNPNNPTSVTPYGIHIQFRVNNIANYSYVEIRRVCQNTGQPMPYTPTAQSLKFVNDYNLGVLPSTYLTDNPIYVWNFLDAGQTWIDLSDDDDTEVQSAFQCCKAIRYYDETLVLMNIKYPSKNVAGLNSSSFIAKNNQLGFPVMENMETSGHKDIYNQVYFKNHQSGEEEGFGVEFLDSMNTKSFVLPYENGVNPSLNDFQMPDRRDNLNKYADSADYSHNKWRGAVNATDTTNTTPTINTRTFERFDLGDLDLLGTGKGNPNAISIQDGSYSPLTPVKEDDSNLTDLAFKVNDQVGITTSMGDPTSVATYNEAGFSPRYFSQGMAFNGVKTPSWATAFSIVKKPKAQRIVCQGIGVYDFDPSQPANNNIGSETGARRFPNRFRFFTPDFMDTALFNPKIQDFINNPTNYYVELVSPLGFFSELYNSKTPNSVGTGYSNRNDPNADLISYARLIYNSPSINTGLKDTVTGSENFYTMFGTWRNSLNSSSPSLNPPTTLYPIASGTNPTASGSVIVGEQPYMEIVFDSSTTIYWNHFISQVRQDVNEQTVKDFHEPLYIINIVDKTAAFVTSNADNYEETGHLQKIEAIIGKSNSAAQTLILVDERWEDCIPNPFVSGVAQTTSPDNRYCYIDDPLLGLTLPWINITYFASVTGIVNDLIANGYSDINDIDINGNPIVVRVYGVYTNDNINFSSRQFNLIFKQNHGLPPNCCIPQGASSGASSYIRVRYDNRVPIKLFSGDSFIGETVFQAIQDSNGYAFINPLPYLMYHVPSNYQIIKRIDKEPVSGYTFAAINNEPWLQIGTIRQWVIMFCCESMVNVPLCHSLDSVWGGNTSGVGTGNTYRGDDQSFPLVHYVMRPNNFINAHLDDNFGDYTITAAKLAFWIATGVWPVIAAYVIGGGGQTSSPLHQHLVDYQYDRDYPDEFNGRWDFGGFKVNQQYNIDYSKYLNDNSNTSTPIVGFKEVTWFCSRVIWSMPRAINIQDDPNLKSFPVTNVYDISDKTQEIKYAFDDMSGKGGNLFAITGKGICLLFTDKTLISDTTLNQLALINPTVGWIQGEYWLSKTIGSNDEMWRGIAEYINECFIPNNESVFRLSGTQIVDIGRAGKDTSKSIIAGSEGECRGSYYSRLYKALSGIESSYNTPVCAVYNVKDKTYWLKIGINKFSFGIPILAGTNLSVLNLYTLILHGTHIVSGSFINLYSTVYGAMIILPTLDIPMGGTLTLRNIGSYNILVQGDDLNLVHLNSGDTIVFTRDSSPYGWNENTPFDPNSEAKVFVFSENPNKLAWQAVYSYNFDKMLCVRKYSNPPNNTLVSDIPTMINDIRVFGMRQLTTFRLKDFLSNLINGINVNGWVIIAIAPQKGLTAELIDVLIHSDQIPIRVEFAETEDALPECFLDSSVSVLYLKNYRGSWFNQVPRKLAVAPSTSRNRMQNTQFFIKIIHNQNGAFIIRDVITGYKMLV